METDKMEESMTTTPEHASSVHERDCHDKSFKRKMSRALLLLTVCCSALSFLLVGLNHGYNDSSVTKRGEDESFSSWMNDRFLLRRRLDTKTGDSSIQNKKKKPKKKKTTTKPKAKNSDPDKQTEKPSEDQKTNKSQDDKSQDENPSDQDEEKQDESKPSQEEEPDKPDEDKCKAATTCTECLQAAKNITTEESTCVWKNDTKCQLVESKEEEESFTCPTEEPSQEEEEEATPPSDWTAKNVFIISILFAVLLYFRKQAMEHESALLATRTNLNRHRHHETVPLADADDDWGWDDDGGGGAGPGDVELASMKAAKEQEELQMALAMSMSQHEQSPSAPARKRASPRSSKRVMTTTPSMGTTVQGIGRPTRQTKKKEDDIFATMGLSAQPTFGRASSRSDSNTGSTTGALAAAAELAATDSNQDDWDDDADLDDLLNDD